VHSLGVQALGGLKKALLSNCNENWADRLARDSALHALDFLGPTAAPPIFRCPVSDADAGEIIGNAVVTLLLYTAVAHTQKAVTDERGDVATCHSVHHALLQRRGALRAILRRCLARRAVAECVPTGHAALLDGVASVRSEMASMLASTPDAGMLCILLLAELCNCTLFPVLREELVVAIRQEVPVGAVEWMLEVGRVQHWGEWGCCLRAGVDHCLVKGFAASSVLPRTVCASDNLSCCHATMPAGRVLPTHHASKPLRYPLRHLHLRSARSTSVSLTRGSGGMFLAEFSQKQHVWNLL
jgi:hypothetical protein